MIEYFEEQILDERRREVNANKSPNQKPVMKPLPKKDSNEE
jgi:hypothetical protein